MTMTLDEFAPIFIDFPVFAIAGNESLFQKRPIRSV
jgi:hypothetical protein